MEMFGVGRPAVREAILWLSKKGLVSVSHGERTRVTEPDPKDLLQHLSGAARYFLSKPEGLEAFQKTRIFVETGIAREAARIATDKDIKQLESALRENEKTVGNPAEFEKTDVLFHFVLTKTCNNPILTALHDAILGWLLEQRNTSLRHPKAEPLAVEYHNKIFAAVKNHNPEKAEQSMRKHLEKVAELYQIVKK